MSNIEKIKIESLAFKNNQSMPVKYTGKGENISPDLILSDVSGGAVSIAVIMDDLDVPKIGEFNHWLLWNIPIQKVIPENIAHGPYPENMKGAVQGKGWGKNRYKGPNPPFGTHRYRFEVFVLDCKIDLPPQSKKRDLMLQMNTHILQHGEITGLFGVRKPLFKRGK
ncbi:YbhB/YbcL family Raf kinase inhibitor-like protein [Anaeromicropila populeti]|uniref:Phospholipid-binding protein, PBP family n=1 Tax=Anaeromicropila populeti TaxID=37658 RepID=A0A1I6J042_9FIRM|nr:YbhB/YbcL family Raf kinase inhibitor-like protein [Anaeromicropila populeti]SFR72337.1 hypothetical protein SAMN05661086_01306 [Anaeromicropila populeti]